VYYIAGGREMLRISWDSADNGQQLEDLIGEIINNLRIKPSQSVLLRKIPSSSEVGRIVGLVKQALSDLEYVSNATSVVFWRDSPVAAAEEVHTQIPSD